MKHETEPTDTERLDWLSHCIWEDGHCISAERRWNSLHPSNYTDDVNLFTVPSQHVTGQGSLRAAIDAAMEKAAQ